MPTIRGKWLFKETPVKTFEGESKRWSVNFRSNNIDCVGIIAGKESDFPAPAIVYEDLGGARMVYSDSDGWFDEAYRTIDFGSKNQDVDDEFYTWLHTNAEEMEHSIEITSSRTILATAGKYCEKNIAIYESVTDAFWDAYQQSGTRTNYDLAFAGIGWRNTTYQPKYVTDIVTESGDTYGVLQPVSAARMYQNCKIAGHLEVDTSQCAAMDAMFSSADAITSLGTIDTRKISALTGIFGYMSQLVTLRKLILKEEGTQTFSSSLFANDTALTNITIQGTIGNDFTMQYCPALTKESVKSIISALSSVASGKTLRLHSDVKNNFTSDEWTDLKNTKSNWTIKPD